MVRSCHATSSSYASHFFRIILTLPHLGRVDPTSVPWGPHHSPKTTRHTSHFPYHVINGLKTFLVHNANSASYPTSAKVILALLRYWPPGPLGTALSLCSAEGFSFCIEGTPILGFFTGGKYRSNRFCRNASPEVVTKISEFWPQQ